MKAQMHLISLALFGGSLLAGQSGQLPLALSLSVSGVATSSYLLTKVPHREDKLISFNARILELESEVNRLTELHQWQQQLIASTDDKLASAIAQKDKDFKERLESILETHQATLSAKDDQLHLERSKLASVVTEWEQRLAQSDLAYRQQIEEIRSELTSTYQWRDDVRKSEQELKALQVELNLKQKALTLEEKRIKLDVRDERGQTKELLKNSQLEIQALTTLVEKLKQQIAALTAQNEQLYNELYAPKTDKPEDELLTVIQATLGQHGIQSEFISRSNNNSVEVIKLKPTTYWEPSKLKAVEEILPGLIDIPQPKIEAKKGQIQIKIDRRDELDRIKDAPDNWLEILYKDAAKDGKNLAILGARGKGKTKLAINYCGLVVNNEPDCEVIYVQPKIDGYATFAVKDKVFEPDYIGFESITSSSGITLPSAYDGILYLRQLYSERNSINQQCFADKTEFPKFNRVFFLIDELQLLVSREKEFIDPEILKSEKLRASQTFCGKIVRDAVSMGRSLGITVLALGQLPNVSVYGWVKNDLYQFISIFMSANIPEAADSYSPTKEEKARISGELELWRKRASVDSSKDYYCYVRPMDKSGYLALLPAPGKYLN